MGRRHLILSFILFFQLVGRADYKPSLTITDIQNFPKASLTSVESFLKLLPQSYRDYYVLQYESHSLHSATAVYPRMIFYGPEALLMMGVSTNPKDPRYNVVEMIQYSREKKKYEMFTMDFSQGTAPTIQPETVNCQGCHREELRPNFDPYDRWPGAYGSAHDTLFAESKERAYFSEFLKVFPASPRHTALSTGWASDTSRKDDNGDVYTTNKGVGLNGTFTILATFWNRDRILGQILNSPNHELYKYAFAAALLECPGDIREYLPTAVKKFHTKSYKSVLKKTRLAIRIHHDHMLEQIAPLQTNGDLDYLDRKTEQFGFRAAEIERVSRFRYLLEYRNENPISIEHWSLSFETGSYDMNDGLGGMRNMMTPYLAAAFPDPADPIHKAANLVPVVMSITAPELQVPFYSSHAEDGKACEILKSRANQLN